MVAVSQSQTTFSIKTMHTVIPSYMHMLYRIVQFNFFTNYAVVVLFCQKDNKFSILFSFMVYSFVFNCGNRQITLNATRPQNLNNIRKETKITLYLYVVEHNNAISYLTDIEHFCQY